MPIKIAILGLAKSGTTALYQAIKAALPPDTPCVFEPKTPRELQYLRNEANPYALTKIMITSIGSCEYSESDFEKNIVIVRDPRDVLVSSTLYQFNRLVIINNEKRFQTLLEYFKAKEQDPNSISLKDLADKVRSEQIYVRTLASYKTMGRLIATAKNTIVFPYKSLVDGDFTEPDQYLGLNMSKPDGLKGWVSKISRKGQTGDWRNWFTQEDVSFFRPMIDPILTDLGIPIDWELNTHPQIQAAHCSEYILRLTKARKNDPRIKKPTKLRISDLESAASDGKPVAMFRLAKARIAKEGVTEESLELLRKAGQLGHLRSAVKAAVLYQRSGDPPQAINARQVALDLGHKKSAFELGNLLRAPGPNRDLGRARAAYVAGANYGDGRCSTALETDPFSNAYFRKAKKLFRHPIRFWRDFLHKRRSVHKATNYSHRLGRVKHDSSPPKSKDEGTLE